MKSLSIVILLSLFAFTGCGGGGGGSAPTDTGDGGNPTTPTTVTLSGTAIDGLIKNAKVCIDTNENNLCDSGEPTTDTDENGNYSFDVAQNSGTKNIIVLGGIDTATNSTFTGILKEKIAIESSPISSINITPLTTTATLLADEQNITIASAKQTIATKLGLSSADISKNPLTDVAVYKKTQEIVQATKVLQSQIQKDDTNQANNQKAFEHIIKQIALTLKDSTTTGTLNIDTLSSKLETTTYNNQPVVIPVNVKTFTKNYVEDINTKLSTVTTTTNLNDIQSGLEIYTNTAKSQIKSETTSQLFGTLSDMQTTEISNIIANGTNLKTANSLKNGDILGLWTYVDTGTTLYITTDTTLTCTKKSENLLEITATDGYSKKYLVRTGIKNTETVGTIQGIESSISRSVRGIANMNVILQNIVDSKIKATVAVDDKGKFTDNTLPSGTYTVTATNGEKAIEQTVTLVNKKEDTGNFILKATNEANFKAELIDNGEFIYGDSTVYNKTVRVYNYGGTIGTGLNFTLTLDDSDKNSFTFTNVLGSITAGSYKDIPVKISFKTLIANQKTASINLKIKDINNNQWNETLKFDVYRKKYKLNFSASSSTIKGYVALPNNKQLPINISNGYIEIPSLNSEDYHIILSNPSLSNETAYSIGYDTATQNLSNFTETSRYEALNGTQDGAVKILKNSAISAYLHVGDIDFYKISTYDGEVATISNFTGTLDENSQSGVTVGRINIVNTGDSPITSFSLSGSGNENFEIQNDGTIKVKSGANIDYETTKSYKLTANAISNAGASNSSTIDISVNNKIDSIPTLSDFTTTVAENIGSGTTIGTIAIVANDGINSITLSGTGSEKFSVSNSGVITLKTGQILDYETKNSYSLSAIATNSAGNSQPSTIDIIISNVLDEKPILENFTATVAETITSGSTIGTVTVLSQGDSAISSFTLSGTGSEKFSISSVGEITLKANQTLDYETKSSYVLTVTATNTAGTSESKTVTINVSNVNEAPIITSSNYTVSENQTAVGNVTATDPDGNTLTYSLGGTDKDSFTINSSTKAITFVTAPNFETKTSYDLSVNVTDGNLTASKNITVTITNILEVPILQGFTTTFAEDIASGSTIGTVTVLSQGDSTISSFTLSGTGSEKFSISSSGVITLKAGQTLDYETKTSYTLTVTATNSVGTSSSKTVNINVSNVNESPIITSSNYEVFENQTVVGNVLATDPDGDSLTYTITGGVDSDKFIIDSLTGILSFKVATDFENPTDRDTNNTYEIEITVNDLTFQETKNINITVKNSKWKVISAGENHTLAIKEDGTLWAWGYNFYGQVGDGTTTNRLIPTKIGTATDWKEVSAGSTHSMAIKNDGTLWGWGLNQYGTLGIGTTANKSIPTKIGIDTNWKLISAGSQHTIALKTNNSLWAWGYNGWGQVGNGTNENVLTPIQIGTNTDWNFIVTGQNLSFALKNNGTLWNWGGDSSNGTATGRWSPGLINDDNNWKEIATGAVHFIALKTDGTIWTWGSNHYGQLGDGTTTNKSAPIKIGTESNWQSISAVNMHSKAIKTNGTLWAWGINEHGELGDGTLINKLSPIQIGNNNDWNKFLDKYLSEKNDGTQWLWGYNRFGQLGNETLDNVNIPIEIIEP